ncbi:hypothetical protein [Thauera butanivorans]|uniref:hypothetical protein n=1 Tax=Thauera butanivorans TaxID=86174 RepID=UPI0008380E06|nr:hypothetical protein [Thauera butanivorans]
MKERPILFSAPMVRAILEGRKTQTRRIVKPQPYIDDQGNFCWNGRNFGQDFNGPHIQAIASPIPSSKTKRVHCPFGKPGDRLWVREAWAETDREDGTPVIAYRAGGNIAIGRDHPKGNDYLIDTIAWDDVPHVETWRPSIHMPRWASRILLEITAVRVERLQDISEADARAEGIEQTVTGDGWRRYCADIEQEAAGLTPCSTAEISYRSLWESINGPGSWLANPWVWVVEFKRV